MLKHCLSFKISGKFYLVDYEFAYQISFFHFIVFELSTRIIGQRHDPNTASKLFNLRYASLRNVIKRIFGMFQSRLAIFQFALLFLSSV